MKRAAPLTRTRLARGKDRGIPTKVREQVRARSNGSCEVGWSAHGYPRCDGAFIGIARDMHHLVKRPRLHEPWAIVHLCRRHHEMCEGPYAKGRLVFLTGGWEFEVARKNPQCAPTYHDWRIEVRARKGSPLLRVLAEGTIQLW